jgi:hypothetical protein
VLINYDEDKCHPTSAPLKKTTDSDRHPKVILKKGSMWWHFINIFKKKNLLEIEASWPSFLLTALTLLIIMRFTLFLGYRKKYRER